jgi:hypothetical protein
MIHHHQPLINVGLQIPDLETLFKHLAFQTPLFLPLDLPLAAAVIQATPQRQTICSVQTRQQMMPIQGSVLDLQASLPTILSPPQPHPRPRMMNATRPIVKSPTPPTLVPLKRHLGLGANLSRLLVHANPTLLRPRKTLSLLNKVLRSTGRS